MLAGNACARLLVPHAFAPFTFRSLRTTRRFTHARTLVRKLLLALALTGCASSTTSTPVQTTPSGTPEAPAGAITEADLRARLFTYAHDSMGGRMTGEPGLVK